MKNIRVLSNTVSAKAEHRLRLGLAPRGFRGRIDAIVFADDRSNAAATERERHLLERGFVEGADVEVLHEGPLGGDPIAVRINDTTIAIRRREAMAIFVTSSDDCNDEHSERN
jgi:ferrous iron transport protein A